MINKEQDKEKRQLLKEKIEDDWWIELQTLYEEELMEQDHP